MPEIREFVMLNHPSPNFDKRPEATPVDTVVVHATVFDTLHEVVTHFSRSETKVSSHYTIDRDGTVVSHVSEDARAWHAGVSRMKDGRTDVNNFSIGIELVNKNDGQDPFPEKQIQALRDLLKSIMTRHPIRHIVPHYDCAEPAGRKSDPAGFDESWIKDLFHK